MNTEYIHTKIPNEDDSGQIPSVTPYLLEGTQNPCVIVCPGGGYCHLADHESGNIARWLNSIGFSAFVLTYRVAPSLYPSQLFDGQRAVQYVRAHHERFGIDKNRVLMLGSSAGGHLVAMVSAYTVEGDPDSNDIVSREHSRPDGAILCYPVISMTENCHMGSVYYLIGDESNTELREKLSIEKQVHKDMPPIFIWHTMEDETVPVYNTLAMVMAYEKQGLSASCHIYPRGKHGLGLARDVSYTKHWTAECECWLSEMGFKKEKQV